MNQKTEKTKAKSPDTFISVSDKVLTLVERNSRAVFGAVVLLALLGVGYVGYGYIQSSREATAVNAIYQAESALKKVREPVGDDTTPPTLGADKSSDYPTKFAPLVANIETKIKEHSSTKAALVAALNLSYFLVEQNQFEAALRVLDLPKVQPSSSDLMAGFWSMHRGVVYLENKQLDKAIESYNKVTTSQALKSFHSEALLKLGYSYELKGDLAKAEESYQKVAKDFPNTEAAQSAEQYMRVLRLKSLSKG